MISKYVVAILLLISISLFSFIKYTNVLNEVDRLTLLLEEERKEVSTLTEQLSMCKKGSYLIKDNCNKWNNIDSIVNDFKYSHLDNNPVLNDNPVITLERDENVEYENVVYKHVDVISPTLHRMLNSTYDRIYNDKGGDTN